ncbi:ATP-dependent DNA helicase PIF1 [Tanacetum coccineum]
MTPSFIDILQNLVRIDANTIIRQDGRVQSYCGLRLTETTTDYLGIIPLPFPDTTQLNSTNIAGPSTNKMGSLLPIEGMSLKFSQLYFFDTRNEVKNQTSAFMDKETSEDIDKWIVGDLINMLDRERKTTRQYNAPTVSEVAAIIVNDFRDAHPTRDIVVDRKDTGLQRVSELHPSYMALQYPLLFPYGEDGFHEKIPYHTNTGTRKTKRGYVTMKEYYSYIIHQRPGQGGTLLKGGRLFQQYLVDAYTAVEEQRLKWTRNNQDTLRVDLYHNLCDAVTRGDTSAVGLGKRIVLPKTFTGSPRYMMHNYQDAMASMSGPYGNQICLTHSLHPKCQRILEMLTYFPGQKPHDRPKIGTRVFKIKLTELLDDLTKKCLYVIEFQKRGLPHAYILLWLEENCKCKTPNEIYDIISAEMPSPTDDPDGKAARSSTNDVTMFTDWFELNKRDSAARTLTYVDIPKHYVWHEQSKQWKKRKQRKCIGRIVYSSPASRERYYLRMLLNVVRGVIGFEEMMTVNKISQSVGIRAIIAGHICNNIAVLRHQQTTQALGRILIRNYCQMEIKDLLHKYGRSLSSFKELPEPDLSLLTNMDNRLIREALDFDIRKSKAEHQHLHSLLNPEQRLIYEDVVQSVHNKKGNFYFVYGPGVPVFTLTRSMRVNEYSVDEGVHTAKQEFNQWFLAVGDGTLPAKMKEGDDDPTWIDIPEKFLIKTWECPIRKIVEETYLGFNARHANDEYLKERAILTPRNHDADAINEFMFKQLPGESVTYNSADEVCMASTDNIDQHQLYPIEFLNSLNFPGMPPHELHLKKELPIMLLRNLNPSQGLCNGTRLIITDVAQFVIHAKILTGSHIGDEVVIHRIILTSPQSKWPFVLKRR